MSFDDLNASWQEGLRRLRVADPPERVILERVVDECVIELRRRLGGSFTTAELALFFEREGIDWAFAVATRVAPASPEVWDVATIANAAFARYVRSASDYAGGRRLRSEEG